jgi:hypothetical protein
MPNTQDNGVLVARVLGCWAETNSMPFTEPVW